MQWGILSTGYIADLFATDLVAAGLHVAAVGSRSQASADAFAAKHGIARAHGDSVSFFSDPAIDAVYIATPNPMHAGNALAALRAGKHVLLEKPFTMTSDEGRAVIDEAASRNLVVMEAMWTRFLPHMVRAREVVAAGTIGGLRAVEANLSQRFTQGPEHRLNNPDLGGGALLDLGVYVVSLAVDFLGPPTGWASVVSSSPTGVDGSASLALAFGDGRQAAFHIGMDHQGTETASILGTEGRIDFAPGWHRAGSITVSTSDRKLIERYAPEVDNRGMQYEAVAFEQLVATGRLDSSVAPHAHTLSVARVIEDIRDKWRAGGGGTVVLVGS